MLYGKAVWDFSIPPSCTILTDPSCGGCSGKAPIKANCLQYSWRFITEYLLELKQVAGLKVPIP